MKDNLELRFLTVTQRAAGDSKNPIIEGDASVFNRETVIGNNFREMIIPGAFRRVLSEKPDVIGCLNHDWNIVLGRTTAGTLSLQETPKSLKYTISINPKDPEAISAYEKVSRGDITQASFAFTVRTEEWVHPANSNDLPLRVIREVDRLYDVGPCTFGAYPEASAGARSKAAQFKSQPGTMSTPTGEDYQIAARRKLLELLKNSPQITAAYRQAALRRVFELKIKNPPLMQKINQQEAAKRRAEFLVLKNRPFWK